ncbi:MAG: hypothetical protein KGL39_35005 [Patescibacteria group bacterium]|nr:hypothetical protein [Patescibacteria group bacterium]
MTITASGILLQSKQGRILFLKRGAGGDYPGCGCFPGGRQEDGELLSAPLVCYCPDRNG